MLSNEVVEALFLEGFKRGRCHYYSLFFYFLLGTLSSLCAQRLLSNDLCLTTHLSHFASL